MNAGRNKSDWRAIWTHRRRAGSALPYVVVSLIGLIGVASIGVDWGHVEMVKTDMQRCADATARGHVELYLQYGQNTAVASGRPALFLGRKPRGRQFWRRAQGHRPVGLMECCEQDFQHNLGRWHRRR